MRLRFQLLIFMLLRTILNTMHRMVYPFLAVFARALGVDIATLSFIVTARSFVGMFAPFLGSIADHRGRKSGMLLGIFLFIAGMSLVALYPSLVTFSIALLLGILSKYLFDPSMQAYFGDRVPYARRGTALAVTEVAWSLAFIAGVPLMGVLIARFDWNAPFPLLAGLGVVIFAVIWWMIPRDHPSQPAPFDQRVDAASPLTAETQGKSAALKNVRAVLTNFPAIAGISIALWASAANELVNLIFGVWLEDSFGLKIAALAGASAVIGLSELSGEGLVALITDRLGKQRALVLGLIANVIASLLLPIIGRTEIGALVGLFLFYITFEFVLVSHIPLMTEIMPGARATLLSFNVTGHSLGRMIGALCATFIYQRFGFLPVALVAILFNGFALLALGELTEKIVIVPRILARFGRTEKKRSMIILLAYGLSILLFILLLLWILIPALYGLPPVPTKPERIRKALKLAKLQSNEVLYDLGAGDGRVLLIAAREFGAKAVGIEVGPIQCAMIWLRAVASGFGNQIQVRWANFYKADLSAADLVFVYATSSEVIKLALHLEKQLKQGTRVVSISADFPDWEPTTFDRHDLIFVYEMPPTKGNLGTYLAQRS